MMDLLEIGEEGPSVPRITKIRQNPACRFTRTEIELACQAFGQTRDLLTFKLGDKRRIFKNSNGDD